MVPPQLPLQACPLPMIIGCQVSAPGIYLAARPSWMHACVLAPLESPAGGVVRLNLNLKGLWSVKIAQLTKGEKRKKTDCTVARA